ncbi:hypothetical protein A2914_02350 [Candidatus Nomurabacteria bacterium RIFCSPLOWO2_01_FULL_41_21]|uniref:SCP domain-containing protein n=1 Tax=Candidatus Nomurabacteria bacterium RIFCSPLOWO2_01_FULL_41_21 TaxID=1801776 RepID=A0A1F6X2W4_9BACT|nr:MAG: hypothetical protein A2914_02350 [Candidatus Nomurabacteria bacterium RIFCSPLOWO2_01_FULL_41_21]
MFKWFKKYFVPHEHNEFRPHFLRHETVFAFLLFIIILELGFLVQVFIVFDKTKFLAAVLPGVLTALTNEERQDLSLPPLTENELLTKAAVLKAEDMAEKGYFAHTSPDGKSPWYWLAEVGYSYKSAGENLAVNFFESSDVSRAWMNSPTHRANIVKENYTEIGIGIASGVYQGRHTVFVAQFFGTPLAFASTNTSSATPTPTPNVGTTQVAPIKAIPPTTTAPPKPAPVSPPVTPAPTPQPSPTLVAVNDPILNAPTEIIVLGEETITSATTLKNENKIISWARRVLTSPLESITYVYAGIALLFVFALLMFLFIKSELQHPKVIARGFSLIAVIVFLLFVNIKIIHTETLVPENLTANTINTIAR